MILDIEAFLRFMKLHSSRLTPKKIACLMEKLSLWKKCLGPRVVIQRQEFRRVADKRAKIIPPEQLLAFIQQTNALLPENLKDLKDNPADPSRLHRVVGLLVGGMVATTGHRKCIFLGMTVGDVEKAEAYKGSFTITVPLHKTVKTFGAAKVCIGKDLFKNLKDFSTLRPSLRGYDKAETLFFNSTGHEMTRMGVFVGRMWGECGLPGTPTLKDIRIAISTHTDVALPFDKRQDVCRAMAHDPKTASLYYVPEASGRQTRTIRLDILRSLMASVKQRKRVSEETQD
ncbi:uncharacterized protein LOC121723726 isoform X2 [Alosa sapidissima]|uniref:uncharacterized protein LOC121723726 isoform X2 n=1 Tax=Alosa sapidissima TaxID=34773 RepID=UPI001C085E8F|nr:uncharacterized protein LOC121723726 isoform X2 [Alosa sapidissima]XP_041965666.1 uncharacterized protein LOC121723726 isoform X2 [Alosa sapidissima]